MNVAYNMDCMDALRKIPDLCFDLAVVDPPYGIGESGAKAATRSHAAMAQAYKPFAGGDRDAPPLEYFRELVRVSKNQIIFGVRIHPTQKPVALYAWIFSKFAHPGEKILDTHLGSGSSRIAAHDAGLDFVGFEIDPDYFTAQEERYSAHTAQISIFAGGQP